MNQTKENKIPCGHKNCPRANNGLTYCDQTNNRIREYSNKIKDVYAKWGFRIHKDLCSQTSVNIHTDIENLLDELLKSQEEYYDKGYADASIRWETYYLPKFLKKQREEICLKIAEYSGINDIQTKELLSIIKEE